MVIGISITNARQLSCVVALIVFLAGMNAACAQDSDTSPAVEPAESQAASVADADSDDGEKKQEAAGEEDPFAVLPGSDAGEFLRQFRLGWRVEVGARHV